MDIEAAVVGAGAVGLACGDALAHRGRSTLVLETEAGIGQGTLSRCGAGFASVSAARNRAPSRRAAR